MKKSNIYNIIGGAGIAFSAASVIGIIQYDRSKDDPDKQYLVEQLPTSMVAQVMGNALIFGLAGSYCLHKANFIRKEEKKKGLENKLTGKGEQ